MQLPVARTFITSFHTINVVCVITAFSRVKIAQVT